MLCLNKEKPMESWESYLLKIGFQKMGKYCIYFRDGLYILKENEIYHVFTDFDPSSQYLKYIIPSFSTLHFSKKSEGISSAQTREGNTILLLENNGTPLGLKEIDREVKNYSEISAIENYTYLLVYRTNALVVRTKNKFVWIDTRGRLVSHEDISKVFPKAFSLPVDSNGFSIGGKNSNQAIQRLQSINNVSIQQLELVMKPDSLSGAGFLGPHESLIDVLLKDNDYVCNTLGLSHQMLAEPLQYIVQYTGAGMGDCCMYKGVFYKFSHISYSGSQDSPFQDNTRGSRDITVTNTQNNKSITFSSLLPHLISRYGFYEGHGTSYRLDPKDILAVFPQLKK